MENNGRGFRKRSTDKLDSRKVSGYSFIDRVRDFLLADGAGEHGAVLGVADKSGFDDDCRAGRVLEQVEGLAQFRQPVSADLIHVPKGVLNKVGKHGASAFVLMQNKGSPFYFVPAPIHVQAHDDLRWHLLAQFLALSQVPHMPGAAIMPAVVVAKRVVPRTVQYRLISVAFEYQIKAFPDGEINVFFEKLFVGSAAVDTPVPNIDENDRLGEGMAEIVLIIVAKAHGGDGGSIINEAHPEKHCGK